MPPSPLSRTQDNAAAGENESEGQGGESNDRPTGDDIKFDKPGIVDQLGERGWSEQEIRDLTKTDPSGSAIDNIDKKNDPASVYGTRGEHVVVNDKSGQVVQVSDKNSWWIPDSRIKWKEDSE